MSRLESGIAVLLLTVGLAGCASQKSATSSEQETEEETTTESRFAVGKYVVVPGSAEFASNKDGSGETWSHDSEERWVFEIVSAGEEWIGVRPPASGTEKERCYGVPMTLRNVALQFYVRKEAVLSEAATAPCESDTSGGEQGAATAGGEAPDAAFQLVHVKPGADLYWPGGAEAGSVEGEEWLLRVETKSHDGRACYAASFVSVAPKSYEPERHFRVCVDKSALSTPQQRDGKATGTTSGPTESKAVDVFQTILDIRLKGLTGGLDWEDVKGTVVKGQGEVKDCYDEEVSGENQFGGSLPLTVGIDADGSVTSVEADSPSLGDEKVRKCVEKAVRGFSFPGAMETSELSVEYVFSIKKK